MVLVIGWLLMIKLKLSLRARLVAAILLIVSISTAGFYYAIVQFIEFHEYEMLNRELAQELQSFANHPHLAVKDGLETYIIESPQDVDKLPARLRDLPPGLHDDIKLQGEEYAVGREDVNGTRFYVLMNTTPIEELEAHFEMLAWICAIISWVTAVLLAWWLSALVMRPVSRLVAMVTELQPTQRHLRLAEQFDDREIGLIAHSFDRFLDRLDDFVVREQAFTEDASHELRTPLTIILNAAQLLEAETDLTALGHERVQRILRASRQMQNLIEALLFLAREENDAITEAVSVDMLAQESAKALGDMLAQKGLHLSVTTTEKIIFVPRGMMICIINNLLMNAIHHTSNGIIKLTVSSDRLSVQDTGNGVPLQDVERIFERRYRGEKSHGLGLGLYLVKRICDRLGWIVQVTPAIEGGARFDVIFSEEPGLSASKPA